MMPATYKTRAIIFRTIKYGDTSLIAQMYTLERGMQSYMLRGVRKKNAKMKAGLFQPLQLLDMLCSEGKSNDLHYVKDLVPLGLGNSEDLMKNAVRMLLNEILLKCIRESESNEPMFLFIEEFLMWYAQCTVSCHNGYLSFLLEFAKRIGFAPDLRHTEEKPYFIDLYEGCSTIERPNHKAFITPPQSSTFAYLARHHYSECGTIRMNGNIRSALLNNIVDYFTIHVPGFGKLKSLDVLQAVML